MKKLILFAAILFAGVSVVKAQGESTVTKQTKAEATLNVTLSNIQYIEVADASNTVNIKYSNIEDYTNGVNTGLIADHIKVSSSGGFIVNVLAADLTLASAPTTSSVTTIAASSIEVQAEAGTDGLADGYTSKFALANTDLPLITSSKGGINKNISVTYYGSGGDAYVSNFTGGSTDGSAVYTTTLYYSIVPN